MKFRVLSKDNVDQYIDYLKIAMAQEPEMMTAEKVDEEGIKRRVQDPFYARTTSILAIEKERVVGRIEYHFYGCMQDGYRMAYVDWVYVLQEFRQRGIAKQLFRIFEKDCAAKRIDQYYLIRATNPNADGFYHGFEAASLMDVPLLRKYLSK